MKEVKLVQEEQLTLNDVSIKDQLGFILNDGNKGHFVFVGDSIEGIDCSSAISMREYSTTCNVSLGDYRVNRFHSIPKNLSYSNQIVKLYKCETRKELYKWLSE
jgi:hypothetical protein